MKAMIAMLLSAALVPAAVWADDIVQRALQEDVVLRALVEEVERGIAGLELEDLDRPYFIEYALRDTSGVRVSAELGAVTNKQENRSRRLRSDVRVGSYELDNTNFGGRYGGRGFFGLPGGMRGASAIPIEDDYNAIRQAIWWATDRHYKRVVETLVQKRAFMEGKLIEDKPNDFSRETPVVYLEDRSAVSLDSAALEETAVALSAVFREYPDIQDSRVDIVAAAGNKYVVNTEGTRLRTAGARYSITVNARAQADDGMELSDSFSVHVRQPEDLPPLDELTQRCRKMSERLIAVRSAPVMEEAYTGPVLFEAEPAAAIFSQHFSRRFAGGQRPVGSRTGPDDFANKLNRRILPRFMNVDDDPTQETIADTPVMGRYLYDDQGVKARPVRLVEGGRLKALLMSRNPSKEFSNSNGHGRGSFRPRAAIGCLIVSADPACDTAELKQALLDACQDEDLAYGIRIAAMSGSNPLVMYKVYPDGREELVRGGEIARVDLKAFKRLLAAGDTPHVANSGGQGRGETVVSPALLFEELDLAKIDRDFDKPPILPTPLARDAAD